MTGHNQGIRWDNVIHLSYLGGIPTQANLVQLGNQVSIGWGNYFRSWVGTGVSLDQLECTDIGTTSGVQGISTQQQKGADINAQDQPLSAATCISWVIDRHYRGGHPRYYLPFCASLYLFEGRNLSPTYLAGITPAANGWLGWLNSISIGALSFQLVGVSYVDQKAPRPVPQTYPVRSVAIHPRVDTRRRRLGKETY